MGPLGTLFAVLAAGLAVFIFFKVKSVFKVPKKPHLGERWWKVSKVSKVDVDNSIRPFKIQVPEEVLKDLKDRLERTLPFQKSLDGVKQHYGMNDKLLSTIVDFWKTKYNWKEREIFLNMYPQFKTNIQGLDIHYIHVKPEETQGVKILPLLLIHGWPGSVREFYEAIPLLTIPQNTEQKFVFELIIPSLPGYGFSEAAEVPGLSVPHICVIFKNLMLRLGFQKYYIQGGDWGAVVVSAMATLFPEYILGMHSNMCTLNTLSANIKLALGSLYPSLIIEEKYQHLVYPRWKKFSFLMLETGYFHIQATKPDTVGVALRESPAGLAAYILEKFTSWTNPEYKNLEDGGLTKKFKIENLLDNVMIYWVTRSITTSQRLYAENMSSEVRAMNLDKIPVEPPAGCAHFTRDLLFTPESILKEKYKNLIHSNVLEGGHFAAFEVPDVLVKDIIQFVEKVEESTENKIPTSTQ